MSSARLVILRRPVGREVIKYSTTPTSLSPLHYDNVKLLICVLILILLETVGHMRQLVTVN